MKLRVALAAAALLLVGAAQERTDRASPAEVSKFLADTPRYRSYPSAVLLGWERDIREALKGNTPDRAAALLAPRYGLPEATMRELVRLWLYVAVHRYGFDRRPAEVARLQTALHALVRGSKRAPVLIEAAAESLDALADCRKEDFDALMAGSTDPADAMRIADAAACTDNYARAIAAAPSHAMPALIRLTNWGPLKPPATLPLYAWLTSDAALARVAEADRANLAGLLLRRRADLMFGSGLTDEAVALIESLSPDLRTRVLASEAQNFTATVDGTPLAFKQDRPDESVKVDLAIAYALAGRTADAEALFAAIADVPAARRFFDCATGKGPKSESGCGDDPYLDHHVLVLDRFLHHAGEDPYLAAEALFAGDTVNGYSGPKAALICRYFADEQYAEICKLKRMVVISEAAVDPESHDFAETQRAEQAIATLGLAGYAEGRAAAQAALDAYAARNADAVDKEGRWTPRSIDPATPPFTARPLPARFAGKRGEPGEWPAGLAKLPEGYAPVRFERAGSRAVALSVSQNYDPTGEITQGGYWVHLSDDGGKSWQAPLYTGLADHFPYVVPAASRMPMLNGEAIDLEVEIAELDTASITYPPVGLRTRRRQSGLFLKLPIADLTRDSDGDGFTDIAARHLLLDKARTDGGTPFVVGTSPAGECRTPPSSERLAVMALLGKLFSAPSRGILEPIDRPAGDPLASIGQWGSSAESRNRPILIKGDPRDYACMRPERLTIVYGDKDIEELQRHTPDFRTVEVPRIIYNRARDRAYVKWSAGWVGGTYRMRLMEGSWKFDEISSWIT